MTRIAMVCLSTTESANGDDGRIYAATFFPMEQPGSAYPRGEATLSFGTNDPGFKAGEVYFLTIDRG